jgi:hypothetical protein
MAGFRGRTSITIRTANRNAVVLPDCDALDFLSQS